MRSDSIERLDSRNRVREQYSDAEFRSPRQLSYAAGSTSLDPDGYRIVHQSDGKRLGDLVRLFPSLTETLHPESIIINAYPATLGLNGFATLVDTYLHPPTLIRSLRLAAKLNRPAVFAAQPLAGADLLNQAVNAGHSFPRKMLWAHGGYYLPRSLEQFVRDRLTSVNCELDTLHCFGVAEIAHTCFAAVDRFHNGFPRFVSTIAELKIHSHGSNSTTLTLNKRTENLSETFRPVGDHWSIQNGPDRLDSDLVERLESWSHETWSRRTGYRAATLEGDVFQLRQGCQMAEDASERRHFEFWDCFGGSFQTKPVWGNPKDDLPRLPR